MTFGERLYLALVLAGFAIFAITLAVVGWRTERFLRRAAAEGRSGDQIAQKKAA